MTISPDYFEMRPRQYPHPGGEVRVAPQVVYPDSALGRATNALGPESGLVLGQRVIEELEGNGGTLVLASHPGQGKSTVMRDIWRGLINQAHLAGKPVPNIVPADIRDDIADAKRNGWNPNVLTWNSDQWGEVDAGFRRRLEQMHEDRTPGSVILVETGGTNFTVDGVERNQGGESLRWLVSAYNPFVLFFRAASRSVPELAGITREMALEFASNSMLPRRLRQEHSLSFVGSSGRVTRGMLRGAPAQVIDGFEAEIEHQAMSTDEERMQSMLQRVQRPSGVSLEEAEQAARGAAVYALQIEDLGALGSHDGLPTVLYTYPPTEAHPLRVRMPE